MAMEVLVRIGPHSRGLRIESQRELVPTIRRSFADVPRVVNACKLLVQIKDEDRGGEFVDLKEDQVIPDRSVLNVIPQVGFLILFKTFVMFFEQYFSIFLARHIDLFQGKILRSSDILYCFNISLSFWNRFLVKYPKCSQHPMSLDRY